MNFNKSSLGSGRIHGWCGARKCRPISGWQCVILAVLFFSQALLFGKTDEKLSPAALNQRVKASSASLVDAATGQILFSRNPSQPFPPASTTKLMTALLVYEQTRFQGEVHVVRADTLTQPSHIPLHAGETVSVRLLARSLLVGSENDAALALARHTSGSVEKFVALMNKRARELGCTGTSFKNPNGLPAPNEFTTANDLLKIFQAAIAVPEIREICRTPSITIKTAVGVQHIQNHNKLLGVYPGMGPAKTGWTISSQHTYAASATRNGHELHLIILHSPDKWDDAKMLFDFGFAQELRKAN